MEIKQLRYFKRVADAGSVSRAAASLSVAQPAVSRQIANLEETLGTPLFFRNGRGVKLTDAGQQLYSHSTEILESIRLAEQDVRDTVGVARGTILFGSMPTVVRHVAPPLLRRIEAGYPELALEFTEGFSGYVNEWLSNGLLDVAVIHDATRTQHFLTEPLVREDLALVSREGGAKTVTFRELANRPLVLPRKNHGLRLMLERVAQHARVPLDVRTEIDSLPAILDLVRAGTACSVLPMGTVSGISGIKLQSVAEPALTRTLLLATSSQRRVSQTTRAVIQEIKSVVRELSETGAWPGTRRGMDGSHQLAPARAMGEGIGHAA